jgi:hypothetical protein
MIGKGGREVKYRQRIFSSGRGTENNSLKQDLRAVRPEGDSFNG